MRKGQIWVETVIYTLIGLALIALVLAFITPSINRSKDNAVVEQSINSLNEIDQVISTIIEEAPGNRRSLDFTIRKGELYVNGDSDNITMVLSDLDSVYSEPGTDVRVGRVIVRSEEGQETNTVTLVLDYKDNFNILYSGENVQKKFTPAPTPYKLLFSNEGGLVVNVAEISSG